MRELIVVRHGESEGNARGLAQGRRPYPLTEQGRDQAARAGALLRALGWVPTHVVTSPVRRCVDTAAILVEALGAPAPRHDEAFTEVDCGSGTGRPFAELEREHPELTYNPARPGPGFELLGGESVADVYARVAAGLDRLPRDERILLVTHGAVFKGVLAHLLGLKTPYYLALRYAAVLRLERRRVAADEVFALTHYLHPEEWLG